jgi:hypothetical protein
MARLTDAEVAELQQQVVALRAEVMEWKTRVVELMGVASRAHGFAEGVAQTQQQLNASIDRRVSALECRQLPQALPFGATHLPPMPNTINPLMDITCKTVGDAS